MDHMLFNYHCLPKLPLHTSAANVGCCCSVPASAGFDNHFSTGHLDKESTPTISQKTNENKIIKGKGKNCFRESAGGGGELRSGMHLICLDSYQLQCFFNCLMLTLSLQNLPAANRRGRLPLLKLMRMKSAQTLTLFSDQDVPY